MRDPVTTADGQSYEHDAILMWLEHSSLSPLSGQPLTSKALVRNHALRNAIGEYDHARPEGLPSVTADGAQHSRLRRDVAPSPLLSQPRDGLVPPRLSGVVAHLTDLWSLRRCCQGHIRRRFRGGQDKPVASAAARQLRRTHVRNRRLLFLPAQARPSERQVGGTAPMGHRRPGKVSRLHAAVFPRLCCRHHCV